MPVGWDGHAKPESVGESDVGTGDLAHGVGDEGIGRRFQNVIAHQQRLGGARRFGHAGAMGGERPVDQRLHLRVFAVAARQNGDQAERVAGDAARLEDEVDAAEERAEAAGLDHDDLALHDFARRSLVGMCREDDVEFRNLARGLARDRQPGVTDGDDEVRPFPGAQILDEIAQALDSRGVHAAEVGRRLAPARPDIGDADERHFDALALQNQ